MPEELKHPVESITGISEQDLNSLEISRNAKNEIASKVKIYFKDGQELATLTKIKTILAKVEEFKQIGGPTSF